MPITPNNTTTLLAALSARARAAGVFGQVTALDQILECSAKAPGAPAWYRVSIEAGVLWVSLVTADRWLSQSIEADLVHTGDKIDELLDEELADLEYAGPKATFEHFRSEDKLFTFRTMVPGSAGAEALKNASALLLAYEACFRQLGDMNVNGTDD